MLSTIWNFIRAQRESGIETIEKTEDGRNIIHLNLWKVPKPGVLRDRADRAVLEAFLEKYPWIRIRKTRGIKVEGQAQESSFLMAMASV